MKSKNPGFYWDVLIWKCLLDIQWKMLCLINESKLTQEIRAGDRNLGVALAYRLLFKTMGQKEIISGESGIKN